MRPIGSVPAQPRYSQRLPLLCKSVAIVFRSWSHGISLESGGGSRTPLVCARHPIPSPRLHVAMSNALCFDGPMYQPPVRQCWSTPGLRPCGRCFDAHGQCIACFQSTFILGPHRWAFAWHSLPSLNLWLLHRRYPSMVPHAFAANVDTLGIEPRAFRMRSGCDTTTPCAPWT